MAENINKQLLLQYYGFNEDSRAINNLSTSKAIESFENVIDIEYLNTEQILSSEETGKNQHTEEESEYIIDENNDNNLKSPHVLTIEELLGEKEDDVQESHSETDIIGDIKDDKNVPSKMLTRLEDTFSKAMTKVSEPSCQANVNSTVNENSRISSGPVKKAKKLWRQKTILSKENFINNTPNLLSKYNGISLNLNNVGIFDFPIDLLDKLKNLQMLYLDSNNLSEIPDQLFIKLKNLKWLDVRNNQLLTIPSSIKGHASLETLLLQGNNIERLPLELGLIPNLKNLQVAHNPLTFPSLEILDLDTNKIINFLRIEWNKEHPNEVTELKKVNCDKLEKKPSTIICYQPSSTKYFKSKKNAQSTPKISVRTRSWNYKPSSRCQSAGSDPIYQQKVLWMETAKELLESQSAELQKTIDKNVLDKWRYNCKSSAKKSANLKSHSFVKQRFPPFALHDEIYENNAYGKVQHSQIKSQYINSGNFRENFDKLLESLKKLDDARIEGNMTPHTEKKNLQAEIQKINQLQKQLQNLKVYNESYMGP